jgi:hypothetical protein
MKKIIRHRRVMVVMMMGKTVEEGPMRMTRMSRRKRVIRIATKRMTMSNKDHRVLMLLSLTYCPGKGIEVGSHETSVWHLWCVALRLR